LAKPYLALAKTKSIYVEPIMAEALGMRWTVKTAIDQGLSFVSISSNVANVVHLM
jgi:hypothetical protein